MPVELGKKVDMHVCYFELERDRIWKLEDVQFVKDTVRILQNVLEKRIQKNSIVSSYASLEEILENIGCAVLVFDSESDVSTRKIRS